MGSDLVAMPPKTGYESVSDRRKLGKSLFDSTQNYRAPIKPLQPASGLLFGLPVPDLGASTNASFPVQSKAFCVLQRAVHTISFLSSLSSSARCSDRSSDSVNNST